MQKGDIKAFVDRHLLEAGATGDPRREKLGYLNAASQMRQMFETGKIRVEDFSIKALFEAVVDLDGADPRTMDVQDLSEAVTASAFNYITGELIHKRAIDAYDPAVGDTAMLVTEDTATEPKVNNVAGFGAGDVPERVPEGSPFQDTELTEKRYAIKCDKFGRGISITREMLLWDQTGQVLRRSQNVGDLMGQHRAKMIIQTLEMGPRTAFEEAAATVEACVANGTLITIGNFYNTDHSSVSGLDAQTNANTVSNALNTAGLTAALNLFNIMTDERGNEITITPKILLVHGNDAITAWNLTNSTTQYDTTDRARNPYGPGGYRVFTVISTVFIETSSTRNWYLGDPAKQLLWLWGWKPETMVQRKNSDASFRRDIVVGFRFSYYAGVGHTDYRYIVRGAE